MLIFDLSVCGVCSCRNCIHYCWVTASAHLMFLPSSVRPRIPCWGGCGAPKDLLQTRKPKWSVFSRCTVSRLKTTRCEPSLAFLISCFSLFFFFSTKIKSSEKGLSEILMFWRKPRCLRKPAENSQLRAVGIAGRVYMLLFLCGKTVSLVMSFALLREQMSPS